MPISFYCPRGHRLQASRRRAGQTVECPFCQAAVIVPVAPETHPGRSPWPEVRETQTGPPPLAAGASRPPLTPPPLPPEQPQPPRGVSPSLPAVGSSPPGDAKRREGVAPGIESAEPSPRRIVLSRLHRPARRHWTTVRWLAFTMLAVAAFSMLPALPHWNLETAPGWARAVLLLGLVQAVFALWLMATPDWASLRVLMVLFALLAALYAMCTAALLATPLDRPLPLDLAPLRHTAARWCGAVLALSALATYLAGRASAKWRQQAELEMAARARRSYFSRLT